MNKRSLRLSKVAIISWYRIYTIVFFKLLEEYFVCIIKELYNLNVLQYLEVCWLLMAI